MEWFNKIKSIFTSTGLAAFTWGAIFVVAFILGKSFISTFALGVFMTRNWDWIKAKYTQYVESQIKTKSE